MSVSYDELKSLVRTHEQQSQEITRIRHNALLEVEAAQAEALAARKALTMASDEVSKLRGELEQLRDRRQRERKASLATKANIDRRIKEAVDAAAKADAVRWSSELAMFRQAAEADVQDAKEAARAEHAAAAEQWALQAEAMRQHMALRSERSALRVKEVILSEETTAAENARLQLRLQGLALLSLSLCVRLLREKSVQKLAQIREGLLGAEVEMLEMELVRSTETREAVQAAAKLATSAAETEVRALRAQVQQVAHKQRSQQRLLAEKRDADVQLRVNNEACRVRNELLAKAYSCKAEFDEQISRLQQKHSAEIDALEAELCECRLALNSVTEQLTRQGSDLLAEVA